MGHSILVAYATKHGSTAEVAETIGEALRERGLWVEVRPAAEVADLWAYRGVVLGGAIYMGRLHPDARHFLQRHRTALAKVPLAVFGMGPRTLEENDVAASRQQLDQALAKESSLEPVSVALFGGVVDPAKLRFPFSHMPASDTRDWDAIRTWAAETAEKLDRGVIARATA